MSATNFEIRCHKIRQTLAQRTTVSLKTKVIADANDHIWNLVASQLTPVIGQGGTLSLFNRALHLSSHDYSWLLSKDDAHGAATFDSLRARLEPRETEDAIEASYTLLVAFTKLLASLIGESLTDQLLDPVWEATLSASQEEDPS